MDPATTTAAADMDTAAARASASASAAAAGDPTCEKGRSSERPLFGAAFFVHFLDAAKATEAEETEKGAERAFKSVAKPRKPK